MIMAGRCLRVSILIGLTVLIAIPLYHLGLHADSEWHYTQQARQLYHHFSEYLPPSSTGNVHNNTLYHDGARQQVRPKFNFSSACSEFPDTEGILLLMKTGATESFSRLPTQLLTTMSCLPDFLIFSDLVRRSSLISTQGIHLRVVVPRIYECIY